MQYAQLNENGAYERQINTIGNVLWDENNFCSAAALVKDGKAEQFRIVELHEVDPPAFDVITQIAVRDGGEYVAGRWQYKWRVDQLSAEQVAVNIDNKNHTLRSAIINSTQARLDNFAKTRNYAGILSLCSYATSTNTKFQAEGQYGVVSRDNTWAALYAILAAVEAGTRPVPSGYAEIESELPVLAWPV